MSGGSAGLRTSIPVRTAAVPGPVRAVAFVRQERGIVLAVADATGTVRLFDASTLTPIEHGGWLPASATAGVRDLSWLPRRSGFAYLLAVDAAGTTLAYDLPTKRRVFGQPLDPAAPITLIDSFQEPDGSSTIAIAGVSDTVYLWRGHEPVRIVLRGHSPPVHALRVLRASRGLVVADDRGVTVWDLSGQEPIRRSYRRGRSRSLALVRDSLDRVQLAMGMADGVHLGDPHSGEELAHFAHKHDVTALAVFQASSGEPLLAVGSDDRLAVWSPATEQEVDLGPVSEHQGAVRVLRRILTSQGTRLAAGDASGVVTMWLLPPRRVTNRLAGSHRDWINSLVVADPAGQDGPPTLASASDDGTVALWEPPAEPGQPAPGGNGRIVSQPAPDPPAQVQAAAGIVGGVVAGDLHGVVRRWGQDGSLRWSIDDRELGAVRAMTTFESPAGWRIVTGGAGGHCVVRDASDGQVIRHLRGTDADSPIRAVTAAEVAGEWLVAAGDSHGRITVWDDRDRPPRVLEAHPGAQVFCLAAVDVAGRTLLASGGADGAVRLWRLADGALIAENSIAHAGTVAALQPVAGGGLTLLATGGADRYIRLWNPADLTDPVSEFVGAHDGWVRALAEVPARQRTLLASGGEEGEIRLWEVANGQLLRFERHRPLIRGFRDRPTTEDFLDREPIREELCALLRPEGGYGDYANTGPQVVTIHGPWGTGKSSLMRQLRNRLEADSSPAAPLAGQLRRRELTPRQVSKLTRARPEPAVPVRAPSAAERPPVQHTITAWFNPWAHESSEQVWAGLAWTIVNATRSRLGETEAEQQRYWLRRNLPRLDPAALRRTLRLRIWRPTLAALAALAVPLAIAMVRTDSLRISELAEPGEWVAIGLALVAALVVLVLASYALGQFYLGRASAYLPADVFDGPVHQQPLDTLTGERLGRDLPYLSGAGQLYRSNEDIHRLAADLRQRGYQLVVFVDDLDRCHRRSVADVFEAISSLLSYAESSSRFVIGLDANVVASRLAETYAGDEPVLSRRDPDDPNPGWSLLRKMSQLTVILPTVRSPHTARLLRRYAHPPPTPNSTDRPPAPPAPLTANPSSPAADHAPPFGQPPVARIPAPRAPSRPAKKPEDELAKQPAEEPAVAASTAGVVQYSVLEGEPAIQDHLSALVRLRPRQTMRETKRLVTLWVFYVRLLQRVLPASSTTSIQGARNAMTLAEIVMRWPAYLPALARNGDGRSGLRDLVEAITNDGDDIWTPAWHAALRKLGLTQPADATVFANLWTFLRTHGNDQVAEFADHLL